MNPTLAARLDGVAGYLHPDEPQFLHDLAARVPFGQCIVEIGAFRGRSTIALASGAQDGVLVYSVDPHEEHEVQGLPFGMDDNQHFMANVSAAGVGHKVRVWNMSSQNAYDAFTADTKLHVGLIFIDGAHDYLDVRLDATYWGDALQRGGLLALHDANTWAGPMNVADELAQDYQWTEVDGCAYTRVFRKETL